MCSSDLAQLGRRLFLRDTHSVRLTPDGEAMVAFADNILDANDRAERYFTGSRVRGRLRFGTSEDFVFSRLTDVLRATEFVVPALEIVDARVQDPRKIFDTVADNGAAAGIVVARSAGKRAFPGALGIMILGASVIGFWQFRANRPTGELNLYTVVTERVMNDDARFAWFVAHGMPDVPGMRQAQSYDYVEQVPPELLTYLQLPAGQAPPALIRVGGMQFAQWVRHHGWSTYARYVLTHPSDTKARILDLASPTLDPVNDDFLPLDSRTIVPRWLFAPWKLCLVTAAAGAVFAVLTGRLRRAGMLTSMVLSTAIIYCAAMLTSGIEHPRHASMVAVLFRVCALAGAAELVRRDVNADATSSVPPAG